MTATIILSTWGAVLSTGLALLALFDRTRARPIIRAYVRMVVRTAPKEPKFITVVEKVGPYGDDQVRELCVEFRVENHGTKPLSLQSIYIETEKHLFYITPEGLPIVLEGQTAATFDIQKEYFDTLDPQTEERRKPEIHEIGFVDGLDRRYPAPKAQLQVVLDQSLALPTTMKMYMRKDHPESQGSLAFQVVNRAIIRSRSTKKPNIWQNRFLFWRSTT